MQTELFGTPCPDLAQVSPTVSEPAPTTTRQALKQYFCPAWAALYLYDHRFAHLGPDDLLWEPAAGDGRMLAAVPSDVPAFGSELDPKYARIARDRCGRDVICGDLRTISLPGSPTAVFGNLPWDISVLDALIERCRDFLQEGQHCALISPSWHIQNPRHVLRWNRYFTLEQEALPRSLFPNLRAPVTYLTFTRSARPKLVGFFLYPEMFGVRRMSSEAQEALTNGVAGPRSVWRELVVKTIRRLGGEADLQQIYDEIEPHRPTSTEWWEHQVRKQVQDERHFTRTGRGRYALAAAA